MWPLNNSQIDICFTSVKKIQLISTGASVSTANVDGGTDHISPHPPFQQKTVKHEQNLRLNRWNEMKFSPVIRLRKYEKLHCSKNAIRSMITNMNESKS